MAKKKKKKNLEKEVKESVHNIWLAGLGAVAAAEKGGSKLFNALVVKGREFEEGPVAKAKDRVKGTVNQVRARAGKTLKSVESGLDVRILSTLERIGVPTRDDIAELKARLDHLAEVVEGTKPHRRKKTATKKTEKPATGKTKDSGSTT